MFYSISSTQKGLAGIDLGNFLIKQASLSLLRDFPQIEQLSTLSPVPGFAKWLLVLLDQQLSGQVGPYKCQERCRSLLALSTETHSAGPCAHLLLSIDLQTHRDTWRQMYVASCHG